MKLYEINAEIERLNESAVWNVEWGAWVDTDTGEIMSQEALDSMYDSLNMNKHEILVWLAKTVLNDRADIDALKVEEARLKKRREQIQKRVDRMTGIIERECEGTKTDLEVATMSYRTSHPLRFEEKDVPNIVSWLESNGYDDCIKYAEPELRKADITKLIKSGVEVPMCEIGDKVNGSLN